MVVTLRTNNKPPIVGIRVPKALKSPLSMPVELEVPVQLKFPVQFSIPHRDIQQNINTVCRHVHIFDTLQASIVARVYIYLCLSMSTDMPLLLPMRSVAVKALCHFHVHYTSL